MTTPVTPIASSSQVNSYTQLAPLMRSLQSSNDSLPKSSLPSEIPGTVQQDTHLLPPVTVYTNHGKLAASPGKLLGYA